MPPPKKSRIKPRYTGERSGSVQQRFIQNAADNPLESINVMDGVTLDKTLSVRCMEELKGERWALFCDRHGDRGRDMTLWAARRIGGYTLVELAREVGNVDYSAIFQSIRRLELRSKREKKLAEFMALYRVKLNEMYNV